jgi:hypothetical protein
VAKVGKRRNAMRKNKMNVMIKSSIRLRGTSSDRRLVVPKKQHKMAKGRENGPIGPVTACNGDFNCTLFLLAFLHFIIWLVVSYF